ncbi:glycoside hydrolase family 15 protein [Marinivivus vitaminiproducens]|uniref:glycoside hydrolase family 15 protein n=1 Tax=Marinivivus vitaminiproducens TaxID=3035935 RepID=UPI002798622A|nr:glycoside hydrolase family 15 protein [Geminicoccaceae bacterium SCSIO 64248]
MAERLKIEDYALIGDCRSAALVGRNGAIDWLCWPRFDSPACFSALLGDASHGRWLIAPDESDARASRQYRDGTTILETTFETDQGQVTLVDFMASDDQDAPSLLRIVRGDRGRVRMSMCMTLRFDYGSAVPWVTQLESEDGIDAIAGPNRVTLRTPVELEGTEDGFGPSTVATFEIGEGEAVPFVLRYGASHLPPPAAIDVDGALSRTETFWRSWSERCGLDGEYQAVIRRSLVTLKALTFRETGGIAAAPTTSLPEGLGGVRNWDYRYCWLRDATLTLRAFMSAGYYDEAVAWRDWLQRSLAGNPEQVQIMYGLAGERTLVEWEVDWLPGYEDSRPVRVGNAAAMQLQIDIYGEIMGALHIARNGGLAHPEEGWDLQRALLDHLEEIWQEPDDGIWETRGERRQFTFSKMMAWVAFDRAVADAERFGLDAPLDRWRALRDEIHETVCREAFNPAVNSFVQYFGADTTDAALLSMVPLGFLPCDDPRIVGTVQRVEQELMAEGFVLRYRPEKSSDGLPGTEGAFLAVSFMLVQVYAIQGRREDAKRLFERLLAIGNDVGLFAEEYDPRIERQVGNFPQAFTHLALVGAAMRLSGEGGL